VRVWARQHDGDSPMRTWTFSNRAAADTPVQPLLAADPTDDWREISDISANSPGRDRPVTAGPGPRPLNLGGI
jgi:hypothetical protein